MKKVLLAILVLAICIGMVGCGNSKWKTTVTDYSGEVSSNGGFLVEKGDWVYFINGSESYTADNTFGSPVKGAIVRTKKSDFGKSDATSEVVVPEVVYSSEMTNSSGLFIFGDYIYYATPCSEKNKDGEVRNTELEYMRTKLDGTDSKVIATISSNSDPYRYVEISGTVYLVLYTTNSESNNVLRVYNTTTCALSKESQTVSSYVLPDDLTSGYAFYTTTVHNDELDSDESFNALHRFALDGSEDVEILNGAGTYSDATNGIGIAGVTFDTVKWTGEYLYLSETSVETSSVVVYKGVKASELTVEASGTTPATRLNYDKLVTLDNGSSLASSIFADSSIYVNLESIFYFDSTYGIVKYDYRQLSNATFGRTKVYYNADILSATFEFMKDGVAYLSVDDVYYSLKLSDIIDLETGDIKATASSVKPKKLNYFTINTSWYQPEIVGNYFVTSVSATPFYDYVYVIDLSATDGLTDDELEDYTTDVATVDREHLQARMANLIGIMTSADKEGYTTYLDENYPEDETTDS